MIKNYEIQVDSQGTINNLSASNAPSDIVIPGFFENAIDANATVIKAKFQHATRNPYSSSFILADNGHGMTIEDLLCALRVNGSTKKPDANGFYKGKGRYGVGLKLAFASLTKYPAYIYTKKAKSNWIKATIAFARDSNSFKISEEEDFVGEDFDFLKKNAVNQESGSVIYIPNTNKMTNASQNNLHRWTANLTSSHKGLGVVFYEEIKKKNIKITVNNVPVTLYDILERDIPTTKVWSQEIHLPELPKFTVYGAMLDRTITPKNRLRKLGSEFSGGSLIRDGQEIGTKINLINRDLQRLGNFRFSIEIPSHEGLDEVFSVNSQKGGWNESNIADQVRDIVTPFVESVFTYIDKANREEAAAYNNIEFKKLAASLEKEFRLNSKGFITPVALKEKRSKKSDKSLTSPRTPSAHNRDVRPNPTHNNVQEGYVRNIKIVESYNGPDSNIFDYYRDQELGRVLIIDVNMDHPCIQDIFHKTRSAEYKKWVLGEIIYLAISLSTTHNDSSKPSMITDFIQNYSVNKSSRFKN